MTVQSIPPLGSTDWYAYMQDVDTVVREVDTGIAPYVPQWTANTAVSAGAVWMSPTGNTILRTTGGTTRATYDATEQLEWTVTSSGGGSGVPTSRLVSTTAPLSGGGALSADLTLSVTASSTTATGVVELATSAETQTGTDTVRAVTPAGLQSKTASATVIGLVELADNTETQTGTDATRAVTPAGLQSKVASETASGIVELATAAETTTGTDNTRAVHPAGLKVELDKKVSTTVTTTTQSGTTYTLALADAGTDIEFTNAAAVAVTIPTNASVAFPVGTVITLWQTTAAGQVTVSGAGVTLQSRGAALKTFGQYAPMTLKKRATDTWIISGDVTT